MDEGTNHLTQAQRAKVGKAINDKIMECPVCKGKNLSVGEIVTMNPFWDGKIHGGDASIAMLQIICSGCFHTMHFAAVPMGLLEA